MLGVDQETLDRWRRETAKEIAIERRQRDLAESIHKAEVTVESDSGRDVSSLMAQLGKHMAPQQFIDKLKKCNPRLVFIKHPSQDLYGIYVHDPTGVVHVSPSGEVMTIKHVCGMPSTIVPEFTVVEKQTQKVPDQELFNSDKPVREVEWKEIETIKQILLQGWRTILLRLLNAKLINEYHVRKHFSWYPSKDSQKWAEMTR